MGKILGKAIGSITGTSKLKQKVAKIPAPTVEPPAPIPDEEQLRKQAALNAAKTKKTGRSSTILSDEERLG